MAAFAAGFFSHVSAPGQSLTSLSPNSNSSPTAMAQDGSSSSSTSSSTISANDFLTLLVTEMKNQDPTANTDPNEYINQLVNVNSLEQLIDINQNLSTALGISGSSSSSTQAAQMEDASTRQSVALPQHGMQNLASQPTAGSPGTNLDSLTTALKFASGNITAPNAAPAAQSVAHALDGNAHRKSPVAGLRQSN